MRFTYRYKLVPLTMLLWGSVAAAALAPPEDIPDTEPAAKASGANPQTISGPRDQLLYEHHCTGCHESQAYIRSQRKVRSLDDIRYWVVRWSTHLGLDWKAPEVESVTEYLNRHYYHFDLNDSQTPSPE